MGCPGALFFSSYRDNREAERETEDETLEGGFGRDLMQGHMWLWRKGSTISWPSFFLFFLDNNKKFHLEIIIYFKNNVNLISRVFLSLNVSMSFLSSKRT